MSITINGTTGVSGVDGSVGTPALQGTDANTGLFYGTDIVGISTGGAESMRIDSSGNVGIGTTSPFSAAGYKSLTINGSTTGILVIQANGSNSCYLYSDGSAFNIKGVQNIPMDFYTNDTHRMRIDSNGKVMFNTSSILNAGYMSLLFDGSAVNGFTIKNSSATFGPYLYFINSAGNVAGYVIQNGTTTVSYTTSSDYRMKENIAPMTGALDKVSQLKPVTYTWKVDGSDGQGFIAHELQAVVPDCVTGEKDAVETYTDEDGVEQTRPKYQGVDTSFLVATLTAAIQEQQTIIQDLKARVTALEASNV